jgi:hypothetical protein
MWLPKFAIAYTIAFVIVQVAANGATCSCVDGDDVATWHLVMKRWGPPSWQMSSLG